MTKTSPWYHSDEMRFGLWGQVRRRWGVPGIKIIQSLQIVFAWRYLVLAVDVIRCELRWDWADRMNQQHLMPIFAGWELEAVVWDGASSHRGNAMGTLGFARIYLPPYSPELNPPERIFQEIRRAIEGIVYPSLQAKQHAINQFLRRLRADKTRLRKLIGWDWIEQVHEQLPNEYT